MEDRQGSLHEDAYMLLGLGMFRVLSVLLS